MELFAGKDGGLSAILQAQSKMLQLAVSQLSAVQTKLVNIEEQIDRLPQQFAEIVRTEFQRQLIAGITGNAKLYAEFLESSRTDTTVFSSPPVLAQLQLILSSTRERRATLSAATEGRGPEAALILPVAASLEVACLSRLGFQKAVKRTVLNGYIKWIDQILGNESGAILDYQIQALKEHDALVDRTATTELGKRMSVKSFRIDGDTETHSSGDDSCFLISSFFVGPEDSSATPARKAMEYAAGFGRKAASVDRLGWISIVDEPEYSFRLLQYAATMRVTAVTSGNKNIEGFLPTPDTKCFVINRDPSSLEISELIKMAESSNAGKVADAERSKFEASIDKMNFHRARIAYAERARAMVSNARLVLMQYRELL